MKIKKTFIHDFQKTERNERDLVVSMFRHFLFHYFGSVIINHCFLPLVQTIVKNIPKTLFNNNLFTLNKV